MTEEAKTSSPPWARKTGKFRVCILDVAKGFTIEATHGKDLSTANTGEVQEYPHDAAEVLKELHGNIEVETLYIKPNVRQAVAQIRRKMATTDVFFNLYDLADPTGQAIVDFMEKHGIAFSGAGSRFYDPTRVELKRICRYYKIDTPEYTMVSDAAPADIDKLPHQLGGWPLFVKPEHGYDSVGIDANSVIDNDLAALRGRVQRICDEFGTALVERYVDGREFSVLCAGTKGKVQTFPPVEYQFPADRQPSSATTTTTAVSATVPAAAAAAATTNTTTTANKTGPAFITFEDKWGSNYQTRWVSLKDTPEEKLLSNRLEDLCQRLYEAFEGEGYARVDVRLDAKSGRLMVLDLNPNCSLFYKDECTADTILRYCGWKKTSFMAFLLEHALTRSAKFHSLHNVDVLYTQEKGFCLLAKRDLSPETIIYSDEMLPLRVVSRDYIMNNWPAEELKTFQEYAWPLGDTTYCIWDTESSKWRPVNHSCDPNAWMIGYEVRARRAIAKGEEITLDYATFLPAHPTFKCWCGSRDCRGTLGPGEYREPWFEARYKGHYSPYIADQLQNERDMKLIISQLVKEQQKSTNNTTNTTTAAATPSSDHSSPAGDKDKDKELESRLTLLLDKLFAEKLNKQFQQIQSQVKAANALAAAKLQPQQYTTNTTNTNTTTTTEPNAKLKLEPKEQVRETA